MIKIDFIRFIKDYTWFGWHHCGHSMSQRWFYSMYWADRLWPIRRSSIKRHQHHKLWWLKIFPRLIK